LRCEKIDLIALAEDRAQLFAEATLKYKEGATWHEMPGQTLQEQIDRIDQDVWIERVANYVHDKDYLTAAEVFEKGVDGGINSLGDFVPLNSRIPAQADKDRVGRILRSLGWVSVQKKRRGVKLQIWRRADGKAFDDSNDE